MSFFPITECQSAKPLMRVYVLGVIENFSGEIFGAGSGEELGLNFLGRVEMLSDYRDVSKPTVLTSKAVCEKYKPIVGRMEKSLDAIAAEGDALLHV